MRWRSLSRAIEGSTLAMSFKTLTPIIIGFIFASFYLTANVSAQVTNFCSAPCGQTSTTCTDQLLDPDLAAGCPQEQKEVWIECPLYPPPDCVSGLRWVNVAKEGCPTSERVPCIQQICCTPCNAGDCGTALPTPTAAVTTTPPPGSTPTAAPTGAAGVPAPSGSPSPGCTEGGPYISAWSVCSASPAKKVEPWDTIAIPATSKQSTAWERYKPKESSSLRPTLPAALWQAQRPASRAPSTSLLRGQQASPHLKRNQATIMSLSPPSWEEATQLPQRHRVTIRSPVPAGVRV